MSSNQSENNWRSGEILQLFAMVYRAGVQITEEHAWGVLALRDCTPTKEDVDKLMQMKMLLDSMRQSGQEPPPDSLQQVLGVGTAQALLSWKEVIDTLNQQKGTNQIGSTPKGPWRTVLDKICRVLKKGYPVSAPVAEVIYVDCFCTFSKQGSEEVYDLALCVAHATLDKFYDRYKKFARTNQIPASSHVKVRHIAREWDKKKTQGRANRLWYPGPIRLPEVDRSAIDLGDITVGETASACLTIKNGPAIILALDSRIRLERVQIQGDSTQLKVAVGPFASAVAVDSELVVANCWGRVLVKVRCSCVEILEVVVAGDGTDTYKSLQEAIDAVSSRGVIRIRDDNVLLTEPITITKPVTIKSDTDTSTLIAKQGTALVVDCNAGPVQLQKLGFTSLGSVPGALLVIKKGSVSITQCQFDRSIAYPQDDHPAIQIGHEADSVTVTDSSVDRCAPGILAAGCNRVVVERTNIMNCASSAIVIDSASEAKVVDCRIESIEGVGIQVRKTQNCTIRSTVVRECGSHGIEVTRTEDIRAEQCSLTSNGGSGVCCTDFSKIELLRTSVTFSRDAGVFLGTGCKAQIEDSVISRNSFGIRAEPQTHINLSGSKICENERDGLNVAGATAVEIFSTECLSNRGHGARVIAEDHVKVLGSTFSANALHGISLGGVSDCECRDNKCSYNGLSGISLNNVGQATLMENTCSNNGTAGICVDTRRSIDAINNTCKDNKGEGISLAGCSYVEVVENNCTGNGSSGLVLAKVTSAEIWQADCKGNRQFGIWVDGCNCITIAGSQLCCNGEAGIQVSGSNSVVIAETEIKENSAAGLRCERSEGVAVSKVSSTQNAGAGLLFIGTREPCVADSTCTLNKAEGVTVKDCKDVELKNLTLDENKGYGVLIAGASNVVGVHLSVLRNGRMGIAAGSNARLKLSQSHSCRNGRSGVALSGAARAALIECWFNENAVHGAFFAGRSRTEVRKCQCRNNKEWGLAISESASCGATEVLLAENHVGGLAITDKARVRLNGSRCLSNKGPGIVVLGKGGGSIEGNSVENNHSVGLFVAKTSTVEIGPNNFSGNAQRPIVDQRSVLNKIVRAVLSIYLWFKKACRVRTRK